MGVPSYPAYPNSYGKTAFHNDNKFAYPHGSPEPLSNDESAVGASQGDYFRGKQMLIQQSRDRSFAEAEAADPESSGYARDAARKS